MIALERMIAAIQNNQIAAYFKATAIIGALQHLDIDKAALRLIMDTDEHARTSGWSVPTKKPRPFKSFD